MAQSIILKRSALPGKVPTTSSLSVGEIAINTFDGKVFINRSGSIQSIQEIITTNVTNTGSIRLTQTGSFGELVTTQDGNIGRDLYVTNDIVGNGDIDIAGNITGSSAIFTGTIRGSIRATNGVISGSSQLTSSFDARYALSGSSGAAAGPNTFDFNLDPEAAGTVNFIEDSTGNTQVIARTGSMDVEIESVQYLSLGETFMNVTTGSITRNYMHLAKYITTAGDLDFNI